MGKRLIKNIDWVITVDDERRMIANGAIAIVEDRIAAVEKSDFLERSFVADDVIDGRGLIAIPGLIDTSAATVQQLGRGAADFCDLQNFMLQRTLPYEASLSTDDLMAASRLCQLEMIRSGTTCFVDSGSLHPELVARAAMDSGLRVTISRGCYYYFDTFWGAFPKEWPRE